jgi:type IV secretion system protein VirB10
VTQAEPEIVVPAGTIIPIVLSAYLNTHSAQVGDSFYADTVYPIWIQQRLIIPKGSTVKGTVTEVVRPGRVRGKGRLAVRLDSIILPNGVSRDFVAAFRGIHSGGSEKVDRNSETVQAETSKGEDVGTVVGTTGQGAIIGAIADRGTGAAIGAGAGAAAGLAFVMLSRGRDLILPPGTQFDVEVKQPLRFTYGELQFSQGALNGASRTPVARPRQEDRQFRSRFGRYGFPVPWFIPWP